MKTRPRFRTCMCENGDWLDNSECGKLFEIAIKCPFIPPEDPRCSKFGKKFYTGTNYKVAAGINGICQITKSF